MAQPDLAQLEKMIARFAPVEIRVDTSRLSPGDRKALPKLIEAARAIDDLYLTQVWSGNHALLAKLSTDQTPLGKARLHYFLLNKGPWSELDGYTPFIPGVPATKPSGANFYPADMTKAEFEAWEKTLPAAAREQAFFPAIVPADVVIGSHSVTKGGVNIGGGLSFRIGNGRTRVFAEARYHHMYTSPIATEFVPVTFGLRW